MNWRQPLLLSAAVLFLAPPPFDLDVGIPPGSPASWGRRYPAITPRSGPLFPKTGPSVKSAGVARPVLKPGEKDTRTVVRASTVKMDVNISTSIGVVRIVTWDLAAHLTWVSRTAPAMKKPSTGRGGGKTIELPYVTDGLYWANMASLLRLMLHPQMVSEKELIVHLVEIGEPLLAVLDNSVSESSLVPPSRIIRKMVTAPVGGAVPLLGKSDRETMLKRFLAEELVQTYPYDPEGGFGRRFYLFSDEVQPYLIDYAEKHPGSFLRRNAVSAVGRYRTDKAMNALGRLAARTDDPVVLMRCLAALGAYRSLRDRGPLLARMEATKDPIEKIAFVVAAGGMGMNEAVPYLLKLGGRARDPDLIQAIVAALARIDHRHGDPAVSKFAKKMVRLAGGRPANFRVKARSAPNADRPDTGSTRGEIIHQLAMLLWVRVTDKDKERAKAQVLGLLSKPGKGRPSKRPRGGRRAPGPRGRRSKEAKASYANASMRAVHPPVQMLFLETLRLLGSEGIAGLTRIAKDVSVDPVLRGHALSQLSWAVRGEIAAAMLNDDEELIETKIYAIEVVANDGAKDLEQIARRLLTKCGKASAGANSPQLRYLWLQALRALDKRSLLKTADLIALMKYPEARKLEPGNFKQRVRNLVEALVRDVADGLSSITKRARIGALLDFILSAGIKARFTAADRRKTILGVSARLRALKGHRADRRLQNQVVQEVLMFLVGFKVRMGLRERTEFRPVVMLEEEILLALGRTESKEAGVALVEFLRTRPGSPVRAHAALALGILQKLGLARHLVPLLKDPDGFTRFCAYESLRHLTNKDVWADWMYGDVGERDVAAARYEKLVGK